MHIGHPRTLLWASDVRALIVSRHHHPCKKVYVSCRIPSRCQGQMYCFSKDTVLTLCPFRMLWAFSRDGGIPFHRLWSAINKTSGTPILAVWAMVTFAFLLGLPMLHSTAAFQAVTSISTIGLYISCTSLCNAFLAGSEAVRNECGGSVLYHTHGRDLRQLLHYLMQAHDMSQQLSALIRSSYLALWRPHMPSCDLDRMPLSKSCIHVQTDLNPLHVCRWHPHSHETHKWEAL